MSEQVLVTVLKQIIVNREINIFIWVSLTLIKY